MNEKKVLKVKRINKELDKIFKYNMTIVSAAMGYGKTTSVQTFLSNFKKVQVAWVSLLGSDGQESLFWNKFTKSLSKLNPEESSPLKSILFPLNLEKTQRIVEIIKAVVKDKCTVLVIDDYHLADSNKNLSSLLELLTLENIPNFHMVIITRTRPKFNMINLVSKGLCYTIGAKTLAFTLEEVKEYFNLMKHRAKEDDLIKIYNYTRGWVSAVYLMLLGLNQGYPVNETININQLVEENLYNSLDYETREILLKLSIFDEFTLEQASYILDKKNIYLVLENMINKNAFVEYDLSSSTYKFHNVLRDYLRKRISNFSIDETNIYYMAGKWFYNKNNIPVAFDFYHRAGKIEELLEMMNNPNCVNLSFTGYELQQKIYNVNKNLCLKFPFPFLQIACNFIITGEIETTRQGIEIANMMYDYFSNVSDISDKLKNKILGELEIIKIFIDFNDCTKMVEHSKKAHELLNGGMSSVIFRNSEFTFGLPHFLYAYYKEPGSLKKILECILSDFPPSVFDYCGYGCELIAQAEYYLETGNYKKVENFTNLALLKAKSKNQDGIIICAYFSIIRLKIVEGDFFEAANTIEKLKEYFNDHPYSKIDSNNAVYHTTIEMVEGYIYTCLKNLSKVPDWLKEGQFDNATLILKGMSYPYIIYAKSLLLSQEWLKLEVLCEELMDNLNYFHNQLGILYCLIYESVAKCNIYGIDKGIEVLVQALKMAQKDNVILPFAENADYVLPILDEFNISDIDFNWLECVKNSCKSYSENLKNYYLQKRPFLTNRERQVLELLKQGLTQKEISKELFISVSSVKRYLESLYRKLNANNKTMAINNAKKINY